MKQGSGASARNRICVSLDLHVFTPETKNRRNCTSQKKTGSAGPVSQREKMLLRIKMAVQSGINMV
jgi:hypothetical protein